MNTRPMIAGLVKDGEWVAIKHRLSLTTEERRRKESWRGYVWVSRYRWQCSCGWRSAWRDHPRLTWRTARAHTVNGQLQARL